MKKVFSIALAIPFVAFVGCAEQGDASNDETTDVEEVIEEAVEDVVEPEMTKEEEIQAYLDEKGWEAEKHESGLYYVIDEPGEGDARPTLSDEVTIFYQGYLLDGFRFDGTGDSPATFGLYQLISGWQIGIPMFGKGGKGKLIIPSELGYGDRDNGDIPGGSTLMFEIELIDFQPIEGM
ncbi:MAG: FKBP-type peptidyl-prolyl cis-trans isomerase [Crocinitomicaceae bacterium]